MSESGERPLEFCVEPGEDGRADLLLARRYPGASRRRLDRYFQDGQVRIDGRRADKGTHAAAGARVTLSSPPPTPGELAPVPESQAELIVLLEQPRLLALCKPGNLPSHPLKSGERGTLANALVARFPECVEAGADPREAGLAHRLDTGTSGVLLAARDRDTWQRLRATFSDGAVEKQYLALVAGRASAGESEEPLAQRGPRVVAAGDGPGLPAHTTWEVEEVLPGHTLLRCSARTGRMHQVRAHLAQAGFPLVGDTDYGGPPTEGLDGHFLHAERIALAHPWSGERLRIHAPLTSLRAALLARLRAG